MGAPPAPDRKTVAIFGVLAGVVVAVLFGLLVPWLQGRRFPAWPWGVGSVLSVLGLAAPTTLVHAYRAWKAVGSVLGWVNARILLGAVYFLVVIPVGAVMRLTGRDPLRRKFEPRAATYRIPSGRAPRGRMEVPF